jgi:hypothetical protein
MTAVQRAAATGLTLDSDLGDLPSTLLAREGRIAAAVIERSVPVPASGRRKRSSRHLQDRCSC